MEYSIISLDGIFYQFNFARINMQDIFPSSFLFYKTEYIEIESRQTNLCLFSAVAISKYYYQPPFFIAENKSFHIHYDK